MEGNFYVGKINGGGGAWHPWHPHMPVYGVNNQNVDLAMSSPISNYIFPLLSYVNSIFFFFFFFRHWGWKIRWGRRCTISVWRFREIWGDHWEADRNWRFRENWGDHWEADANWRFRENWGDHWEADGNCCRVDPSFENTTVAWIHKKKCVKSNPWVMQTLAQIH